ncbi:DUF975 family protein [Oribacterium sp. WCC10]|uniref:DUF975 family protein n=1 Tax=Oribacterium sp. WCC10 TaxID=1855343 RepID=UPI0008EEB39C|nr:DUF975 family protein [Oribacterium sp. WCC10]SFG25875.1 Uncharacterized membrane protein [Oribacterium sp. WCC10]
MMTLSQIKSFAKRQLNGNLLAAIGAMILSFLCSLLWCTAVFFVIIVGILGKILGWVTTFDPIPFMYDGPVFYVTAGIMIAALLILGLYIMVGLALGSQMLYLDIARGKKVGALQIFRGFKDGVHMKNYFLVVLLIYIIEILITAPDLIIGFRSGFRSADYTITNLITNFIVFVVMMFMSLSTYASADHREMNAFEAVKISLHLMRNRKFKLLVFELSFIGWILLMFITGGLAGFWVIPYFNTALAIFYLSAYGEDYQSSIKDAEYRAKGTGDQGRTSETMGGKADAEAGEFSENTAEEPKDVYVKGDASPDNKTTKRSFEEVRDQYTDTGSGDTGIVNRESNTLWAESTKKEPDKMAGEWTQDEESVASSDVSEETVLDKSGNENSEAVSETAESIKQEVKSRDSAEIDIAGNDKPEDDAFADYEKWKRDHGITIDNPDPFHTKYQNGKKGE